MNSWNSEQKKKSLSFGMWKSYHYITRLLQTSSLENSLVFSGKKYTQSKISRKWNVTCHENHTLHVIFCTGYIMTFSSFFKEIFNFKTMCRRLKKKKICPELYHSELATRHYFFTMPDFTVHRYVNILFKSFKSIFLYAGTLSITVWLYS